MNASPILAPVPRHGVGLVKKRDGRTVQYDANRVTRAIALALFEVLHGPENPDRQNVAKRFGLDEVSFARCAEMADQVELALIERFGDVKNPGVEDVQDQIELVLLEKGAIDVVRSFVYYRQRHALLRPVEHKENGLSDFVALTRYCRFDASLGRRETWEEAARRVRDMHRRMFANKFRTAAEISAVAERLMLQGTITEQAVTDAGGFRGLSDEINDAFALVGQRRVLPSMRSMQFGGRAIEEKHARIYNCAYSPCNRREFFREYFYLLLCGAGCGFSVQRHHVAQLPAMALRPEELELRVEHFDIPDTIEGWADAIDQLIVSHIRGYKVEFNYRNIRPRGAVIKSSGGRAPGHVPLKKALDQCERILTKASGRQLRSIEVYDMGMFIAQAVLAGGSRRSATICLFSADDDEMMSAKTGDWMKTDLQRTASNNSAVIVRDEVTHEQFQRLFENQKKFGEPGFFFTNNREYGANPCVEIVLNPTMVVTEREIAKLRAYGYEKPVEPGDVLTGWQMCNLSTISGAQATSAELFFREVKAAAVIGTLQAAYTKIDYLGPVTRVLNEREALIGVSICGVLDNPDVLLDPATLQRGADVVKAANAVIADVIGINRAARTTCVKPEGTSSLVLNSASGIHPHHARRYFRRVEGSTNDAVTRWFERVNPHMVERSLYKDGTRIVTFPVEAPPHAILRDDVSALALLSYVKTVQTHWVQTGRAHASFSDCHHNVSNTITVQTEEWDAVADFIWENRHQFTGVALLRASGDKDYAQAPREAVSSEEDIRRWNSLVYTPVDYTKNPDAEDTTAGAEHRGAAVGCAGGFCEL